MTATEQSRFDKLYNLHLRTLKLRGMSDKTKRIELIVTQLFSKLYNLLQK